MNQSDQITKEIALDFDNTVGTEDRFAIRHFLEDFMDIINNQSQDDLSEMISGAATAEGFSEFVMQKQQILDMFYNKFFGRRNNYINLSKSKLTFIKGLFVINGEYEECSEGILAASGGIQMSLVKTDDRFEFVNFKFYPRMRMSDSNIQND